MIKIMLWSKIILFFLLASSSVCSPINNYVDKYYFERDGKHYVNIFALKKLKIVFDTEILDSFNCVVEYDGVDVFYGAPAIELWFSTSDIEKNVYIRIKHNLMNMTFPPPIPKLFNYFIESFPVADYYREYHLNFSQESGKNVLEIKTKYAPEVDIQHCSFFYVWPSTAHFRIPPIPSIELDPPDSEYDAFDEACHPADRRRCDIMKLERGVSFPEKGVIQFLPYLVDKKKEYEFFHPPGDYSPIYSIVGSTSCNKYSINLTFSNLGYMNVKRKGEKFDIKIHMGLHEQAFLQMNISKDADIKFYFEEDLLHFYFFETRYWQGPYSAFHLATFVLKTPINETKTQTKLKIDSSEIALECASIVKLVIGKNVTLLIPFPSEINSTVIAMTTSASVTSEEIKVTSSTTELAVASAGLPLGAFIGIGCFCLLLLLIAIAVVIYLIIRCLRKPKSQTTPPTTLDVSFNFTENELILSNSNKSAAAATSKKSETSAMPEAVKKFRPNEEIELARREARKYEVKIDSNEPEEIPLKNFKLFDLKEFKLYLPPAFFAMREFYEDNLMEECQTGIISAKGTLVNNFWELFPFIKNDKQQMQQRVTLGLNNYMFFVVRDLASPENKVFRKFGARFCESINDNDYEVLANQENGKRDPVIVRVFVLSHDPPGVECIVNGRCPEFFSYIFKCQLCKNVKPEHFTSKEKLSRCLRSLPLGHHIVVSFSDEKDVKNVNSHITILTFKGGRQSIPLDMKHRCPSIHYTHNIKLRGQKLANDAPIKMEEKTKSVISIVNSAASTTGSIKQKTDEEK